MANEDWHTITDDQVKRIYQCIVGKSFENSGKHFEELQSAWNETAHILGVIDITNNGHGIVRWIR